MKSYDEDIVIKLLMKSYTDRFLTTSYGCFDSHADSYALRPVSSVGSVVLEDSLPLASLSKSRICLYGQHQAGSYRCGYLADLRGRPSCRANSGHRGRATIVYGISQMRGPVCDRSKVYYSHWFGTCRYIYKFEMISVHCRSDQQESSGLTMAFFSRP